MHYEKTTTIVVDDADLFYTVDIPGRCRIDRVCVVRLGDGAIQVDFYNRAFTSAEVGVKTIRKIVIDSADLVELVLESQLALAVGDAVTVGSSNIVGYNTTHRIVKKIDDWHYVTDQTWTADEATSPATVQLEIPEAEWPLYAAIAQLTGNDNAEDEPWTSYHNQDPQLNLNRGVNRKIYLKFDATATYRVSIRTTETIGMGG